jgi:ferredoxin
MGKSVKIDLGICQGHGKCYALEPDWFTPIDDMGRAEFTAADGIPEDDAAAIGRAQDVIDNCPEMALDWA